MKQDYFYPFIEGDYTWNIYSKCIQAIGREPVCRMLVTSGTTIVLTFDPPLDEETERPLISAIMANNPCDPIVELIGMTYKIKDLYEALPDIEEAIGFPVYVTYGKSSPELNKCDEIFLTFAGKMLTNPEKKAVKDVIDNLIIGWV